MKFKNEKKNVTEKVKRGQTNYLSIINTHLKVCAAQSVIYLQVIRINVKTANT
jgi:hypothetical protein